MTLPTNRKTGTAISGKESREYSIRCATRSTGMPLIKRYAKQGRPIARITGNPSRKSVKNEAITIYPATVLP
jgi:hypothetical protein